MKSIVATKVNPPSNPPTVNLGVPNLVGIAKNMYRSVPQVTVNEHFFDVAKFFVSFKMKVLSYSPSAATPWYLPFANDIEILFVAVVLPYCDILQVCAD